MAYPVNTSDRRPKVSAMPDWVLAYYTPEKPANRPEDPNLSVLEQMYAYYEA